MVQWIVFLENAGRTFELADGFFIPRGDLHADCVKGMIASVVLAANEFRFACQGGVQMRELRADTRGLDIVSSVRGVNRFWIIYVDIVNDTVVGLDAIWLSSHAI